jgi:lysine decarboxylase
MADTPSSVDALVSALIASIERYRSSPRPISGTSLWGIAYETVLSPREAFFARHAVLSTEECVGRICAELVAPYPPGVPVLAPGERITAEAVEYLLGARAAGTRIAYAADATLATLRVVA